MVNGCQRHEFLTILDSVAAECYARLHNDNGNTLDMSEQCRRRRVFNLQSGKNFSNDCKDTTANANPIECQN